MCLQFMIVVLYKTNIIATTILLLSILRLKENENATESLYSSLYYFYVVVSLRVLKTHSTLLNINSKCTRYFVSNVVYEKGFCVLDCKRYP